MFYGIIQQHDVHTLYVSFFCSYKDIEKSKLSTIFQVLILQKVHTGT